VELAQAAAERIGVLGGEAEAEGGGALAILRRPLVQIVDRCRALGPEETARVFAGTSSLLATHVPQLPDLPHEEVAREGEDARERLFRDLLRVLAAVAPALLVLDDLHRADEVTLGWLRWLAEEGELGPARILIAGSYRSEERSGAIEALLRAPGTHEVR